MTVYGINCLINLYMCEEENYMPNLVQNPGFEAGLAGWTATNVAVVNGNPFEGTASARMGPGMASIFQDIPIIPLLGSSYLLSFAVQAPLSFEPGELLRCRG